VVASIVILASVPPVSRDALTHHLAIPKLYLKQGKIYEIPDASWSYYPMNLDLLYMIPLYFGNDIIPKFIHFAFALLTGWLIFRYLRKHSELPYAIFGVLFFLSLPIIIKLSITVYVDLGLIFFSTASLIYFLKWIDNDFNLEYLLISALWCGLSLGTKYTGLVVFFLLTLFTVFIYARTSAGAAAKPSKAIGFGIAFMLVAIIVFSPWAIRNYIWTHNPIYPLYNNWFDVRKTVPTEFSETNAPDGATEESNANIKKSDGGWRHFAVRKIIFNEKWWEILIIPIRIFFQGEDDNPKYFDGRLNPLLFFLPIFAFLPFRRDSSKLKTEKKILLAFSILFILYAFFLTDMRIRYMGPAIPPLVMLSMLGLKDLSKVIENRFSNTYRNIGLTAVYLIVFFLFCSNAVYIFNQFRHVEPIDYIRGRVGRDEYIERYRPEYAAIQFANLHLSKDVKILSVFLGNRRYYSDRHMIFNIELFKKSIKRANSPDNLSTILKENGITHLLVRFDLLNRWSQSQFSYSEIGIMREFFENHVKPLFSKGGHGLFEL
jgi:hypothetical protein